jgi:hypothetical protein
MINFKLKELNKIEPVGREPELMLSWFYLTDGYLWLTFGDRNIYEYTNVVIQQFEGVVSIYCDYYLVRFIEDFTALFEKISEGIPAKFYDLTDNIDQFQKDNELWIDLNELDDRELDSLFWDKHEKLISWINERTLRSSHLIGGPKLRFFRFGDNVKIIWDTDHVLENGTKLWTAENGQYQMSYVSFVNGIRSFADAFFKTMDAQVELAITKEWGDITVDKKILVQEHKERKMEFYSKISLLESGPVVKTNWDEIEELYSLMDNEINGKSA